MRSVLKSMTCASIIGLIGIGMAMAGSLTLLGAGGGAGSNAPSWVASTCPTTSGQAPNICIDFVNNRAYDAIAGLSVTPASLLSAVNATPPNYTSATQVASISANTPGLGTVGLQASAGVTNLLLYSNTFTNADWVKASAGGPSAPTVTTGVGPSPDGTNDASQTTFATNTTAEYQSIDQNFTTTVGTLYTCSIWVQAASGTPGVYLGMNEAATPYYVEGFSQLIQPTSTWARYTVSGYALTTDTGFWIGLNTDTVTIKQPYGVGGTINYFGAQCVTGPAPGPYVATTSAQATSRADQIEAAGDFKIALATSNGAVVITTGDGYQSDPFRTELELTSTLLSDGSNPVLEVNGSNQVVAWASSPLTSPRSSTWTQPEVVSVSWNSSASDILNLNGAANTDSGNSRSIACSSACYLGSTGGSSNFLNGHIATIAVYPAAITPATSTPPITSLAFNVPGITHYTVGSAGTQGDTLANTFDNGQLYSVFGDSAYCNAVNQSANNGVYLWQASGSAGWTPGTAPNNCSWVQTWNASPYYLGTESATESSEGYRNWKSWGLSGVNGAVYDAIWRNTYGMGTADAQYCTTYYTGVGVTCQTQVQYSYYATLISASLSGTSSSSPMTSSTTWTGSFPTASDGPSPSPMFSDATLGTSTTSCGAFSSQGSGCGHYFSIPEIVKYGVDQSATATYGSGSTYVCTGGVASGCPDGSGTYVYAVSNDGAYNVGESLQLGRVAIANISSLSASNWQFWDKNKSGCSGVITDNNCWIDAIYDGTNTASPILGTMTAMPLANSTLGVPSIQWFPAAQEYVMLTYYFPTIYNNLTFNTASTSQSMWQIWTAKSLVGPWTMIQQHEWKSICNGTSGGYGTSGTQCGASPGTFSAGSGFYAPALVQGAIVNGTSTDGGLTGAILVSGNFQISATLYGPNWIPFTVNY